MTDTGKCALVAGTILRRPCGAPSTATCVRCLRAVCETHVRHLQSVAGATDVCVECMPKSAATPVPNRSRTTSSGSSSLYIDTGPSFDLSSDAPAWSDNAGGEFGGGGASGGWDPADAQATADVTGGNVDAAGFSPQDYAAFDSMADSDKSAPGYDS